MPTWGNNGWKNDLIKQRRNMIIPKIVGRYKMNSAKQINQSTNYVTHHQNHFDNAITTNTSFAMKMN